MEKRLMNIKELSEYLGTPKGSLYTMVCLRKIPQACIVKLGRSLRFERAAIDNWINAKRLS
jgi:excisionase family DNA binding protein